MKKLILAIAGTLIIFSSCNDDENITNSNQNQKNDVYLVTLDEALSRADVFFAGTSSTRKTHSRSVKSVQYLNSDQKTRSLKDDITNTLLYLVNYENDEGFALLSGDKRTRAIYAIADEGELNLADTVFNKGLSAFVDIVNIDLQYAAANYPTATQYGESIIIRKAQVGPLLKWPGPRYWGQGAPYNRYCFTQNGKQAVVGCTAISIAQIMSWYAWPDHIGDEHINWHTLKKFKGFHHDNALLFARLGESDLLNMNYGETLSVAAYANYQRTFTRMGYLNPGSFKNFIESSVRVILDGGDPVLVTASEYGQNVGHSWVIDGYARNVVTEDNTISIDYNTTLFHCIWGWAGRSNGYFYWGNFNGSPIAYDKIGAEDYREIGYNFNWNIKYMTNFVPNK